MGFRDLPFARLTNVFVIGGLTEAVLTQLPAALESLIDEPSLTALRRSWPDRFGRPRVTGAEAKRLAAHAFVRVAEMSSTDLVEAAFDDSFRGLPISGLMSGDRVAIVFAHAVFDGVGAVEIVELLLARAAGVDVGDLDRRRPERAPLLRSLRLVRARDLRRSSTARPRSDGGAFRAIAARPRSSALAQVVVDRASLAEIRRIPAGGPTRATVNTRICSLVLTALQQIEVGRSELEVLIPVGMRHLVQGRVDGNFVASARLGPLDGSDWSPSSISSRLAEASSSSRVVEMALTSIRTLVGAAVRGPDQRDIAVSVSLLPTVRGLPAEAFVDDRSIEFAAVTGAADRRSIFVFVLVSKSAAYISVWDDTGTFDVAGFEQSFRNELTSRTRA